MNKYPAYKDSGIEWLGEIPEHWEVGKKIKYLFKERTQKGYPEEPLLAATQTKGVVPKSMYENRTVTAQKDLHLLKLVDVGDFVISLRSFQGGIEYAYYRGIISSAYTIMIPHKPICRSYCKHLFKSTNFLRLLELCVTGIREGQNINYTMLKEEPIPIPPLSEQEQIASFLDEKTAKIDRLIDNKRRQIELLKEQRQAVISHAVTKGLNPSAAMKDSGIEWLGEIPEHWMLLSVKFALDNPITDGPHETPEWVDDGIPFISAEAIKEDKIDFERKRGFISQDDHKRFSRKYVPQRGDVYVVKSGATTGSIAKVETDATFNIWSPLAALRPKQERCTTDFLFYFMKSKAFLSSVETGWNYGTQQNIGMGVLSNLPITLPPFSEQEKISAYLNSRSAEINKTIANTEKQIELLKEYRTALISDAVTGKIDVREALTNGC